MTLPDKPMTVGAGVFEGVPDSCIAYIPRGAEANYGYTGDGPGDVNRWMGLRIAPHFYNTAVDVNEQARGTVTSTKADEGTEASYGTKITLTAIPTSGHRFLKWADANAKGATVSTQNPYTLTVQNDMAIRAYFTTNLCQVSLSAGANGRIKSGENKYAFDTRATIEAESDTGYYFVMWADEAGDIISSENPYTFTVKDNTTMRAYFAANNEDIAPNFTDEDYLVKLSAAVYGLIKSGSGKYAPQTTARIEAEAYAHYHFVKWTNDKGDSISSENPYVFTVESDTAVRAYFEANLYPVNLSAEANGSIKAGGGSCAYHTWTKVEAEANAGYHFAKWTDGEGNSVSTANPYSFVVMGETELKAVFAVGETHALPVPDAGDAGSEVGEVGEETPDRVLNPVRGNRGDESVYYAEGMLQIANLEGYLISVSTIKGERVLQFTANSEHEQYAAALPAGIYILNAAKRQEKAVAIKFVVK
ncbi:hypothetical protein Barb7_01670 [Bacteroidales bacterium Barb7]|nr:hypothetical protein Barb7_01670 [Bacteroidales bacterium Barb7]